MNYKQFQEDDVSNREKLLAFRTAFENYKPVSDSYGYYLPETHIPFNLMGWFDQICHNICGLTTNSEFRCKTIWSDTHGPKSGALIKTYFRADKLASREATDQDERYLLALCSHNTQADTDMSDDVIMGIHFTVYSLGDSPIVTEYSFNF